MGILKDIFTAALWGREPPAVPDWVEKRHVTASRLAKALSL